MRTQICGGVALLMIYGGVGDWRRIDFDGTIVSALYILNYIIITIE
jgi:hypothetical protein